MRKLIKYKEIMDKINELDNLKNKEGSKVKLIS